MSYHQRSHLLIKMAQECKVDDTNNEKWKIICNDEDTNNITCSSKIHKSSRDSENENPNVLESFGEQNIIECESQGNSNIREDSAYLQDSLITDVEPESHSTDNGIVEYDKEQNIKECESQGDNNIREDSAYSLASLIRGVELESHSTDNGIVEYDKEQNIKECESQSDSNIRPESAYLQDSLVTDIEPESHSTDNGIVEYDKENTTEGDMFAVMKPTNIDQEIEDNETYSDPYSSDDSRADPHYNISESSSSTESSTDEESGPENDNMNIVAKRNKLKVRKVTQPTEIIQKGKKRKRNTEDWLKNKAKRLRNSGESYVSSSSKKKVIPAKKLLPPCTDKCKLKCFQNISEDDRQQIFNEYWGLGNLEKQRQFLSTSMTTVCPKYRYVRENSHRRPNNAFFFEVNGRRIRVCKLFFKSTLSITDRPLRTVLQKRDLFTGGMLSSDSRGKHGHHVKVDEKIKNDIREHIKLIPRVESHYCRAKTEKQYIEGGKTMAELHRDYRRTCEEKKQPFGNYIMYARIFNEEFKLSFFVPKKDQCELCVGFNNATEEEKRSLQEKYDEHRLETDLSRKEKEQDKISNNTVAVYDLQAVLPCPSGDASSFYYVSKVNVYNLTVCNIQTKNVHCYMWHEGEALRGVNEIGSCILRYLNSLEKEKNRNIIFFSDNCAGQQKNRFMIAAYVYAILNIEEVQSITHKFLITGHSQNEGDSAHSVIERQVKRSKRSGPVYIPDQYVTLVRSAKKSGEPYKVDEICYEDIFDLKQLAADMGLNSFSKNTNGEAVRISDMKVFKITKEFPGTLFYKNSYQQEDFDSVLIMNQRKKNIKPKLKKAYKNKVGISEKKKKGLMSLFTKNCIPKCYLPFYESL